MKNLSRKIGFYEKNERSKNILIKNDTERPPFMSAFRVFL